MLSLRSLFSACCLILACGLVLPLAGQETNEGGVVSSINLNGVSTSVIEGQARALISDAKYAESLPYLRELYDRLRDTEQDMVKLEVIYYYLAIGFFSHNMLAQGIAILEEYRERFPEGENFQAATNYLADAYKSVGRFSDAIPLYRGLLLTPRGRNEVRFRLEILEHISEAYFYDRPSEQVTEGEGEDAVIVTKVRDPLWDEAIPAFEAFMAASQDEVKRAKIGSFLLQGYIAKKRFDNAFNLIPTLLIDSPNRYDISFNIALLEAGDQMFGTEEYARASFFYSLTLPKERIQEYFEQRIEILNRQKARRAIVRMDAPVDPEIERGIRFAEAQLKILETIPNYTSALRYRWARTFLAMGRDWEGFWAFMRLWEEMPEDMNAEEFLFTAFIQATKIKQNDKALELGQLYYSIPAFTKYRDPLILALAQLYLDLGMGKEFRELAEGYIRDSDPDSIAANGLVFLLGSHMIREQEYGKLKDLFGELYRLKGDESLMAPGLMYWGGMTRLMLEEYDELIQMMGHLCELFPYSPYAEDALFRIAVAYFGKGEVDTARERFEDFILEKPQSILRPEAEVFLGDIAASQARVNEALEHYENVQKYTREGANIAFISHAVFQATKLFEVNKRYADMMNLLNDYVIRYRDEADISNAVYQLGRAYELSGNPEGAMEIYFDAVKSYGDQKDRVGIDYIIQALPEQYKKLHMEYPVQQLRELYDDAVASKWWTKVFRLESALEASGVKVEPTYVLLPEMLNEASPASLVYLAHRYKRDNYILDRAYELLISQYADTDFVRFAYMDLGNRYAEAGDYVLALDYFTRFSTQFPTAPEAGRIELRKAEMLMALKRYDEARLVLESIRRVREWRGRLYGEALFLNGMLMFEQQKWTEAHALFQQAYSAYAGYPDIAARAFLWAGNSLESMGMREEARRTYEAFMRNPNLKNTEVYEEIRMRLTRI